MAFPQSFTMALDYARSTFDHIALSSDDVCDIAENCVVCGGSTVVLTRVSNRHGEGMLDKSICSSCGYVSFSRMPSETWVNDFYRIHWDHRNSGRAEPNSSVFRSHKKNLALLEEISTDRQDKVLDVGVGYGGFLAQCQERGFSNLWGIEASASRARFVKNKFGLNVSVSTIEEAGGILRAEGGPPFDVIHSHQVLEHVFDINGALESINDMLKPGGRLLLFVPNVFKEPFFLIAHFMGHIRNFTPLSLTTLLQRHGFRVEQIDDGIAMVAVKETASPKSTAPQRADLDPAVYAALAEKVERDFGLDVLSRPLQGSTPFWRVCDSIDNENPIGTSAGGEIDAFQRLRWQFKRGLVGIYHKPFSKAALADVGRRTSLARSLMIRATQHVLPYGRLEIGGSLSRVCGRGDDNGDVEARPMVEFRYMSDAALGLFK